MGFFLQLLFRNVFRWSFRCITLICLLILTKTQYVYKPPPFFCSFTCTLGYKNAASNGAFTCPTPYPIERVQKYGLALSQISKSISQQSKFMASATPATSTNTTQFNLMLTIDASDNIYFTFTIVAIGYQAQNTCIDLFNHFLKNDMFNTLKTWQASVRNYTVNHLVTAQTRFTLASNLNYATFISYYSLTTSTNTVATTLSFTALTNGFSYIQTKIEIQNNVGLNYFGGMVIVFDTAEMSMSGAIKLMDIESITNFNVWDLGAKYPQWGPQFNSKCILGIYQMYYMPDENFNQFFVASIKQNWQGVMNNGTSSVSSSFHAVLFCVSTGDSECNEDFPFYDSLDQGCYIASACPVPTIDPGIYPIKPQLCTLCSEINCIDCDLGDRANCILCDSTKFTTAISGDCQCMDGYYKPATSTSCGINCTYHMPNCKLANCSSTSLCTECEVGFLISISVSGNQCKACSSFIPNCLQCLNQFQCTLCDSKSYLEAGSMSEILCTQCNLMIPFCATCTPGTSAPTCNTCYPGYIHTTTACVCSTLNLTGCVTCDIPTQCTQCRAAYYVHPVSRHCQFCTTLFQCQTCSGFNNCTKCNQYYKPYFNSSNGSSLCKSCAQLIPNCVDCATTNVCILCDPGYGVDKTLQCSLCSVMHPHCVSCTDYLACLQCESNNYTFLINGKCKVCSDINSKCLNCQLKAISSLLQCTQCIPGYVLNTVSQVCYKCSQEIDDCEQCVFNSVSGKAECTLCSDLFLVDENSTCKKCKQGNYVTRSCSFIQGCASSHIINGVVTCLMCDSLLNFMYNTTSKKCECQKGYVLDATQSRCTQVCGDSMVNSMQCDDGNTRNGDGCSDKCQIEGGFECKINSKGVSECVINQEISVVFDYMLRDMEGNKVEMYFSVTPAYTALSKVNWQKTITFNFSQTIQTSISYSDGILVVTVQYGSDIDQKMMEMQFTYDPSITKSNPQILKMKMSAVNGPLTYQSPSNLASFKVFNVSGLVLGIFCFLFYLVSSYFHKMIGLQTIQFIQLIYYVRLIAPGTGSSSLYGLNSLKYANGYNDIVDSSSNNQAYYKSVPAEMVKLNLKIDFLQNCNLMLIPLGLACIGYVVCSIRKSQAYSRYMKAKDTTNKDNYIAKRRQVDFVYDSFIFTFTLSLFYIAVFSMLVYELSTLSTSSTKSKAFESLSYGCCALVVFFVSAIFCYEAINGVQKYFQQKESKENVKSDEKSLEHEANAAQYAFHPLYVTVYLAYQLSITTAVSLVFAKFALFTETVLILSVIYLVVISVWKPYSLAIHNGAIIFNQSAVVYMVLIQVLAKYKITGSLLYNIGLYLTMVLVMVSLVFQIVRLYVHNKTIKAQYNVKKSPQQNKETEKQTKKKQKASNPYSLQNQVIDCKLIDRGQLDFTFIPPLSHALNKNSKISDESMEQSMRNQKINNRLKTKIRARILSKDLSLIYH